MSWRLASSLVRLREQVNAAYPDRSKTSDGSIGDERHQASSTSDHNPHIKDGSIGVVTAIDITHDPKSGVDAGELAEALIASKDSRVKYIIYDKRICASYPSNGKPAWTWRPYSGANAHQKHVHVSVLGSKADYDSTDDWDLPEHSGTHSDGEDATAAPVATSTEIVKTTVVEKTAEGTTTQETSLVSKLSGNETLKTIASEGVTKLATKATTTLTAGSTAAAATGGTTGKTWLIVLSIVFAVGAIAVVLFLLWHKSQKEKVVAQIASDPDRTDVRFGAK